MIAHICMNPKAMGMPKMRIMKITAKVPKKRKIRRLLILDFGVSKLWSAENVANALLRVNIARAVYRRL